MGIEDGCRYVVSEDDLTARWDATAPIEPVPAGYPVGSIGESGAAI